MKTVIIGAGLSGLTLAERILNKEPNADVTIIERENTPGGLARTFHRDGFDFDIGPHRFHTMNPDVDKYLMDILDGCYVNMLRKSSVYMAGKYRNWPLTMQSVLGLPFPVLWKSFLDLFFKPDIKEIKSFSDFIRSRYGNNLYNFFFSGYTRKFTGVPAEELHVDWAQAGVNRAVIDKRVKADTLSSLLKSILLPKPMETTFYYPGKGGIQTFCDMQLDRIQKNGGKVFLNTEVSKLISEGGKVTGVQLASGDFISANRVFWTAPLSILYPETEFKFINTVLACVGLKKKNPVNDYQWCYFGQEDILFSRLTVPGEFRQDCVPDGKDSIIAEITCSSDAPEWASPDTLTERLLADLKRVDAISGDDVIFVDWHKIPETYPVYTLDYREKLSSIQIDQGLFLMGRCGSFWYNNMDHSIAQSLSLVKGEKFDKDFW